MYCMCSMYVCMYVVYCNVCVSYTNTDAIVISVCTVNRLVTAFTECMPNARDLCKSDRMLFLSGRWKRGHFNNFFTLRWNSVFSQPYNSIPRARDRRSMYQYSRCNWLCRFVNCNPTDWFLVVFPREWSRSWPFAVLNKLICFHPVQRCVDYSNSCCFIIAHYVRSCFVNVKH